MPPPKKRQKHGEAAAAAGSAASPSASPVKRRDDADADTDDSDAAWSDPESDARHQQRPSRWHGDRRAWMARTQAEQLTVAAMHGARARDLAAHLYNVYALKQRAAEDERAERAEREAQHEHLAEGAPRADREDSLAHLRRDVKREPGEDSSTDADDYGRGYGGDDYDYSGHGRGGGGGDDDDDDDDGLDDDQKSNVFSVLSTTSGGGSRGSQRGRPWAPQSLWTAWPLRIHERLFDARPVPQISDKNEGDDEDAGAEGTDGDGPPVAAAPASEVLMEELTATVLRLAKVRFRQRQRQWRRRRRLPPRPAVPRRGGHRPTESTDAAARGLPPVVSADDALSAHLLRPGVRHLLTQADRLLDGLHSVRAATAGKAELRDGWRLRDWSDVVGAAALAGFDRAVLACTAQRCADLFDQSMVLADVGGGPGGAGAGADKVAHALYAPRPTAQRFAHLLADDACAADEADTSPERAAASYSGQLGPRPPLEPLGGAAVLEVNGEDAAAEDADDLEAWRQRVQTRYQAWYRDRRQRQHQQILQPQSQPQQQQPQQQQQQQQGRPKSTATFIPGAPQPLWRCRHKTCDRSAIGFERRSNLTRHLRLVHGE